MRRVLLGLFVLLALAPASALAATSSPPQQVVFKGDILVSKGQTTGDIFVVDGNVVVRGTVHGDLIDVNGDVTIRGVVTGDVVTIAKRATLGRRARIGGQLKWVQDRPVVDPGAIVTGKVKKLDFGAIGTPGIEFAIGFWLVVTISFLIAGLLLLWLAPRAADAAVRAVRASTGGTVISGIVLLILLPIIAVALLFTVVGTPIGIGLLLVLGPLLAIAYLTGGMLLGRRLRKDAGRFGAFLVGLIILRILALIPFLGALVSLVATVFGLGALFIALRRARAAA
jgi:cytoskeletal protein CcmA (bactofilin family)